MLNTWEIFVQLCNAAVESKCGLHRNDLPDSIAIDDFWNESDSEAEAKAQANDFADELLADNGFPATVSHPAPTADDDAAADADAVEDDEDGEDRHEFDDEGPQMTDIEADADTLGSAGMGTDEYYDGGCERM